MAKKNIGGIDVCLNHGDVDVPHCPHGPTLLFQRFVRKNGVEEPIQQKFFACSACRDRKDCSFFQLVEEKISSTRRKAREAINKSYSLPFSHQCYYKRLQEAEKRSPKSRHYCHTCNLLLLPSELVDHGVHNITSPISDSHLQKPSYLLRPLDNKKKNAQYIFSEAVVKFITDTIQRLGFTHVLCVGAPSIFEAIKSPQRKSPEFRLEALLLDIDHRFQQFFDDQSFCRYNMFNHHFFDRETSRTTFSEFLKNKKVVLVIDPPFGGLVEVLAHTIKRIITEWQSLVGDQKDELPILWFFPYFLEPKVVEFLPSLAMLDYQVDYVNHVSFHAGQKGRKHGSPVRIFTNIDPIKMVLPADFYRLCSVCKRYVSLVNKHCRQCNACTSKDGRPYTHCEKCNRCVKSTRIHCDICDRCELPDHVCGQKFQKCYFCAGAGHGRRDCVHNDRKRRKKVQSDCYDMHSVHSRKRQKRIWTNES